MEGEWEIEHHKNSVGDYHDVFGEVANGQLGVIADTMNRDYRITPEEDARHARLIAAAPDLLEAAENAAEVFGCVRINLDRATEKEAEEFEAVLQLVAAIAKATGKEQA